MCDWKPRPRCSTHATVKLVNTYQKLESQPTAAGDTHSAHRQRGWELAVRDWAETRAGTQAIEQQLHELDDQIHSSTTSPQFAEQLEAQRASLRKQLINSSHRAQDKRSAADLYEQGHPVESEYALRHGHDTTWAADTRFAPKQAVRITGRDEAPVLLARESSWDPAASHRSGDPNRTEPLTVEYFHFLVPIIEADHTTATVRIPGMLGTSKLLLDSSKTTAVWADKKGTGKDPQTAADVSDALYNLADYSGEAPRDSDFEKDEHVKVQLQNAGSTPAGYVIFTWREEDCGTID